MMDGTGATRPRSTSATPALVVPSPRNMGRAASPPPDTNSQQLERWADVLFAFHAEYPDELTIEVRRFCHWCKPVLQRAFGISL